MRIFGPFLGLSLIFLGPAAATNPDERTVASAGYYLYQPKDPEITSIRATWNVPSGPATANKRLGILVWPGLQNEDSTVVLQPVLQWGEIMDGDNRREWNIACMAVRKDVAKNTTAVRKSKAFAVRPGSTVTGVVELVSKIDGVYTYACHFEGHEDTRLTYRAREKFNTGMLNYQTIDAKDCGDYSGNVKITNLVVMAGATDLSRAWRKTPTEDPLGCGIKVRDLDGAFVFQLR